MKKTIVIFGFLILILLLFLAKVSFSKPSLIKLESGKTYSYDVNNDGKRDRIQIEILSEYGDGKFAEKVININGKKRVNAQGGKGVDIYLFTINKSGIFIHSSIGTGPNHLTYLVYKKGKYEEAEFPVDCLGYAFETPSVKGSNLRICYAIKSWYRSSFPDDYSTEPFSAAMEFKLTKGLFKKRYKYPKVSGENSFFALCNFKTGTTMSTVSKRNGPEVKYGDKIKVLNEVCRNGFRYYKIKIGTHSGWFMDSEDVQFRIAN